MASFSFSRASSKPNRSPLFIALPLLTAGIAFVAVGWLWPQPGTDACGLDFYCIAAAVEHFNRSMHIVGGGLAVVALSATLLFMQLTRR